MKKFNKMDICKTCGKEIDDVYIKCINCEKNNYRKNVISKTLSITFEDAVFKDTSGSEHDCNLCEESNMKRYIKLKGILHPNTSVTWYLCRKCFKSHVDMPLR